MPRGSTLNPPIDDTSIPAMAIEEQLQRLLRSPLFSHSRRYPGLLRHVVDATLKGQQDQLKERSIGIDVFQRSPDYDLNMDPVVRVTAGEVRKRLAQYYYDPEHHDELRIELHPGSYIPEFKLTSNRDPAPTSDLPVLPAPAAESVPALSVQTQIAAASDKQQPRPDAFVAAAQADTNPVSARISWQVLAAGILLLAIAAVGFSFSRRRSPLDEFWLPALVSPAPIMISVGSWGTLSPSSSSLSVGTHAESVSPVALADTITIANLQQFLSERSHATQIQVSSQTTFSDLQRGTAVLVSGFDNQWTLRLTAPLRFHFATHDGNVLAIEDRDNPRNTLWQIDQNVPYASLTRDYAIIARFHDSTTEQVIIVAAGIGENGTIAAGQMLTNPKVFSASHNAAWVPGARNFEAVIETEVIDGKSGPPRIVAVTTW